VDRLHRNANVAQAQRFRGKQPGKDSRANLAGPCLQYYSKLNDYDTSIAYKEGVDEEQHLGVFSGVLVNTLGGPQQDNKQQYHKYD